MILYCFVKECFVGVMDLDAWTMTWEADENLTELARRYKRYIPLDTRERIALFINQRVNRETPDRSIWLSMIGCTPESSDVEIFVKNHGVSMNDLFWVSCENSNKYWYEKMKGVR